MGCQRLDRFGAVTGLSSIWTWIFALSAGGWRGAGVQVSGDNPPGSFRMLASLLLLQAVNHGTEHRSHVPTILT